MAADIPVRILNSRRPSGQGTRITAEPSAADRPVAALACKRRVTVVQITGMKAALTSEGNFPVLFTMSFPDAAGGQAETVCTAPSGAKGATVDVSCVPLFGDVADAREGTVTASL